MYRDFEKNDIKNMLNEYIKELITQGQNKLAKYTVDLEQHLTEKIFGDFQHLEVNGDYSIGTIAYYTIGNWVGYDYISIYKNGKFLFNII